MSPSRKFTWPLRWRPAAALLALCALPSASAEKPAPVATTLEDGAVADPLDAPLVSEPDAQETLSDEAMLELFQFDSQLSQAVVSSTKTSQRSARAPAVVTVISREEIQGRGYSSLAEVLRGVPGFYDVYDLVTHNFGVRGVNGGARASGSILKLMIDGHPVDFRPSTGNFFGEELIPIQLVDRVEIIRGPASALYGANAFLGVVNVITRRGESISGAQLTGTAAAQEDRPGFGGAMIVGGARGPIELTLGASAAVLDRSGLALPDSSPLLLRRPNAAAAGASVGDRSRPRSLFGKLRVDEVANGRLSLMYSAQSLDAGGDFQEFGPLSHGTRIALLNQNVRLAWEASPLESLAVSLSAHYFHGGSTPSERLDVGRDDYHLLRRVGAEGFGLSAEANASLTDSLQLVSGADLVQEDHLLQSYDTFILRDVRGADGTVLRKAGTIIPGERTGRALLRNVGVFTQLLWTLSDSLSGVLGARADQHNIYGVNPSARAGLVFAPPERPLSLKLLYGSSFKAPSAVQLYTMPLAVRDAQGNPELLPQTAHTFELAGSHGFGERGELSVNVYATQVQGRVEFVQKGLYLQARNLLDEWIAGAELDARFTAARPLQLGITAGLAQTIVRDDDALALSTAGELKNPLFPPWQVRTTADLQIPGLSGARLSAEVGVIAARESSHSNALEAGGAYELPPYVFTALAFTSGPRRWIGDRDSTLSLRITNLLNQRWAEPGFGGVDLPVPGITGYLALTQQL